MSARACFAFLDRHDAKISAMVYCKRPKCTRPHSMPSMGAQKPCAVAPSFDCFLQAFSHSALISMLKRELRVSRLE